MNEWMNADFGVLSDERCLLNECM